MTATTLTIFSAPKPFSDAHINTIQRNAIQSWTRLGSEVEVLLIGEETGLAQAAADYGVPLLTGVLRNASGTPLVSSIFELARQASRSPLLAYVNADILLLPDFVLGARQTAGQLAEFLLIGQRWDLDVRSLLDFSSGWEARLADDLKRRGRLHLPAGSDYFTFPRHLFAEMPAFAIGRAGWDNWMIFHALSQGWPVVDGTASIHVIHQVHDYSHLPGGKPHYELPESRQNEALAGGGAHMYMVLDSDRSLINGRVLTPPWTLMRFLRRLETSLANGSAAAGSTAAGSSMPRKWLRWQLARQARRLRRRLTGSLT